MTIIFNFCSLFTAIVCLADVCHWREAYGLSKIEALKDYSNAFLCIALAYVILSFPGLILFNPFWVQIDFILVDISLLGAVFFFAPSTFSFFKLSFPKKKFFWLFSFWIVIYILLNFLFFSPAIPLKADSLIYYWKSGIPWLQGVTRGLICLGAFGLGILFLARAKTLKEKILFWRSLLLSLSPIMVMIAGFILWFFPYIYFSPKILIFSGLLGFSGFLIGPFILRFLRISQERWVRKIT